MWVQISFFRRILTDLSQDFFQRESQMGKKLQDYIRVALLLLIMDWICMILFPSTLAYYLCYIGDILPIFHWKIIEPEHIPCWNLFRATAFDTGSTSATLDREFKHEGGIYIWTHANACVCFLVVGGLFWFFFFIFKMSKADDSDITSVTWIEIPCLALCHVFFLAIRTCLIVTDLQLTVELWVTPHCYWNAKSLLNLAVGKTKQSLLSLPPSFYWLRVYFPTYFFFILQFFKCFNFPLYLKRIL